MVAEPKHFAGHGSPEGGTNTSPVHIGERELRTMMLPPFAEAIREGHAMGVMAAYHEIDGIPITDDPFLLKTILRQEWGFQGFVLSDLGAIERLYSAHHVAASPQDAACMAIGSGVDMQFYDFDHAVFQNALIDCVQNHTLSLSRSGSRGAVGAAGEIRAGALRSSVCRSGAEGEGRSLSAASRAVAAVGPRIHDAVEE